MAEAQRTFLDGHDRTQHVEAGARAQLPYEGRVETRRARSKRWLEAFGFADKAEKISRRIGKALEVVGDREMLHDIAFPGADDTTIRLDPFGHAAASI